MSKKLTINQIHERTKNLYGDEYEILSDKYVNNKTKILIKHNCGHTYLVRPDSFLNNNRRCIKCFGNPKLEISEIKNRCSDIHKGEYEILSDYCINSSSKISVRHNICGNIYDINLNSFLNKKTKCAFCNGNKKMTIEILKNRINEIFGYEYSVLSEKYENVDKKLIFKHNKCGYYWDVKVCNMLSGKSGCPMCSPKSKGEQKIIKYLSKNNILFIKDKSFDGCIYSINLHYDFYLTEYNICIEFDGIQHYKPVDRFGGVDSYNEQIKKDIIKNNYCKNNEIKLIRIPYWEYDNINLILDKLLFIL